MDYFRVWSQRENWMTRLFSEDENTHIICRPEWTWTSSNKESVKHSKTTTLALWCCCIAVQFGFFQQRGLHSVHVTLKD